MKNSTFSLPRRHLTVGAAAALISAGALAAPGLPAATADEGTPVLGQSKLQGEPNGTLGFAVSSTSCDINGDGFEDSVLGDWGWDRPGYPNTGAAYVVLGSVADKSGDVADPDVSGTIRIDGPSVTVPGGAWVGWSVSCLDDVNGDGLDDFVLGAGSRNYQQATVIFGQRDFTPVDLDFLGTRGFVIEDPGAADKAGGDKSTDNFGFAVANVGDVDGDGLGDIAVGDILADYNSRTNSGRVWVIKGQTSVKNVNVQRDTGKVIRTVDGAAAQDRMGSVSAAGDINGDRRSDILVSAFTATPWGTDIAASGAAYAIWGTGTLDLAALDGNGFMIYGPDRQRDRLGASIAGIGDINADGHADIAVGADGVSRDGAPRPGGVAVVLGSGSAAPVLTNPGSGSTTVYSCSTGDADLTCSGGERQERGYWIEGAADGGRAGSSVAGIPDLNADGTPEILVGAAGGGEVWAVYGDAGSTGTVSLGSLTPETGVLLGTGGGSSIGYAGDLNADRSPDVVSGGANSVSLFMLSAATAAPPAPTTPASPGPSSTPEPTSTSEPTSSPTTPAKPEPTSSPEPTSGSTATSGGSAPERPLAELTNPAVRDGAATGTVPGEVSSQAPAVASDPASAPADGLPADSRETDPDQQADRSEEEGAAKPAGSAESRAAGTGSATALDAQNESASWLAGSAPYVAGGAVLLLGAGSWFIWRRRLL